MIPIRERHTQSKLIPIRPTQLPGAKFIKYLLDQNHPQGGSKAKFFAEVLAIGPADWRYVAVQVGVKHYEDRFGVSFNAVIPITGSMVRSYPSIQTGSWSRGSRRLGPLTSYGIMLEYGIDHECSQIVDCIVDSSRRDLLNRVGQGQDKAR
jgi:hypothetical protein